ncbi:hypothetical protein HanXRQr2_Chr03g0115871 [Helianthus annuus]|uniref:Uncharacterized protein n=1 Tax=Helianthus annuus TaxID=4232 RepID=A0A251TZQ0_HELAN|nr:hypothetical protein HanXRQr2_Chr03g0115871 [Helianthus annuus]KAJ0944095.1 hypothetical protein HanPSC8_Chr03g0112291 [Helianthus annuus]
MYVSIKRNYIFLAVGLACVDVASWIYASRLLKKEVISDFSIRNGRCCTWTRGRWWESGSQ